MVGGVELELEPREAAAVLHVVAAPAVGEAVDEQEAVAALGLEAVAGAGRVGTGVEDLDADLLVGGGDADLDRLVLAGAAVLDRVRDELREKQREPVADGVREPGFHRQDRSASEARCTRSSWHPERDGLRFHSCHGQTVLSTAAQHPLPAKVAPVGTATLDAPTAPWRSGYAAACKAVYTGSNPVGASSRSAKSELTDRKFVAS